MHRHSKTTTTIMLALQSARLGETIFFATNDQSHHINKARKLSSDFWFVVKKGGFVPIYLPAAKARYQSNKNLKNTSPLRSTTSILTD